MSKKKNTPKSKPSPLDQVVGWGDSPNDISIIPDEYLTDEKIEVKYNHPFYQELKRTQEIQDKWVSDDPYPVARYIDFLGAVIYFKGLADFIIEKSKRARKHKILFQTEDLHDDEAILFVLVSRHRFNSLYKEWYKQSGLLGSLAINDMG